MWTTPCALSKRALTKVKQLDESLKTAGSKYANDLHSLEVGQNNDFQPLSHWRLHSIIINPVIHAPTDKILSIILVTILSWSCFTHNVLFCSILNCFRNFFNKSFYKKNRCSLKQEYSIFRFLIMICFNPGNFDTNIKVWLRINMVWNCVDYLLIFCSDFWCTDLTEHWLHLQVLCCHLSCDLCYGCILHNAGTTIHERYGIFGKSFCAEMIIRIWIFLLWIFVWAVFLHVLLHIRCYDGNLCPLITWQYQD